MKTKEYTIYTLTCPIDGEIKYVGITTVKLYERLMCHIHSDEGSYDKRIWMYECKSIGARPLIEVVDVFETDEKTIALNIESYWIHQFKEWGFSLYNSKRSWHNKRSGISFRSYQEVQKKEYDNYVKSIKLIDSKTKYKPRKQTK